MDNEVITELVKLNNNSNRLIEISTKLEEAQELLRTLDEGLNYEFLNREFGDKFKNFKEINPETINNQIAKIRREVNKQQSMTYYKANEVYILRRDR